MSGIVLDAGALIALERNDRPMWTALKLATRRDEDVLVPSTVVAQVWRGTAGQALLSMALAHCVVSPFDPLARRIGELCGRTRTKDVCDAHVALIAALHGDTLYTSDPADLRRLIAACGRRRPSIVNC
jgi:predicted nucleic acid-binding protein